MRSLESSLGPSTPTWSKSLSTPLALVCKLSGELPLGPRCASVSRNLELHLLSDFCLVSSTWAQVFLDRLSPLAYLMRRVCWVANEISSKRKVECTPQHRLHKSRVLTAQEWWRIPNGQIQMWTLSELSEFYLNCISR